MDLLAAEGSVMRACSTHATSTETQLLVYTNDQEPAGLTHDHATTVTVNNICHMIRQTFQSIGCNIPGRWEGVKFIVKSVLYLLVANNTY